MTRLRGPTSAPTEEWEQMMLISWVNLSMGKYPDLALLFHIPNGGKRGKAEAGRFKAMGVKAGVPDLCLPVPVGKYHGLFIELKRPEGGRLSREQRDWLDDLSARAYRAVVCHGWEAARDAIVEYLSQRDRFFDSREQGTGNREQGGDGRESGGD